MARIRTIKPQFWGDDEIAELSISARYLALGLVSMADDEGRFVASPNAVSGYVFPHDEVQPKQIRKWLAEVADVGFAHFYTVGRAEYGVLPGFRKHQRISKPQASPIPAPRAEPFRTQSRNERGTIPQGNGMEWNGMEKDDGSVSLHLTTEPRETDGVKDQLGGVL